MKKVIILGALMALLAISLVCGVQDGTEQAPAFELRDLNGRALNLAQFKNKVLVLNFWATWCPPCRGEIPDFVAVYNEYKDKGLGMIGVSLDNGTEEDLAPFVKDFEMPYPVALGTEKFLANYEPGRYIPVTIIIDKKGRIRKRHVGFMDRDTLESLFLEYNRE
jgi:peroxiredoxin